MKAIQLSKRFGDSLDVEWPCPACGQRTVQILKDSFTIRSNLATLQQQNMEWFEADMEESVFSCMASCSRQACGEVVACIGESQGGIYWDEHTHKDVFYRMHRPVSFHPTLSPVVITDKCPQEIAGPLYASFSIFLMQPGSAANLIRIAVEQLLNAIGIPKLDDKSKRINLHQRIDKLDGQYASYRNTLMAIKFLGNAGSHEYDEVIIEDIETAFEMMEYVVNDLFSGRKESIEVLTKRLLEKYENR